jgi:hypothetical protein
MVRELPLVVQTVGVFEVNTGFKVAVPTKLTTSVDQVFGPGLVKVRDWAAPLIV